MRSPIIYWRRNGASSENRKEKRKRKKRERRGGKGKRERKRERGEGERLLVEHILGDEMLRSNIT